MTVRDSQSLGLHESYNRVNVAPISSRNECFHFIVLPNKKLHTPGEDVHVDVAILQLKELPFLYYLQDRLLWGRLSCHW